MAVVNVNLNNMINAKDSRWLQLEVCREYQRSKCSRSDSECKFAHPPANVEVQNGRVIACYDSIKGRCNREKPPCKYFHPPQHLKDQLLINGRNHLALKNALMLQMVGPGGQSVLPGQIPAIDYEFHPVRCLPSSVHDWCELSAASPYLAGVPQLNAQYSHYMSASPMLQVVSPADANVNSQLGVMAAAQAGGAGVAGYGAPANKLQRSDRIEQGYPGMMPYKRTAGDKTTAGMAVYQQHQQSAANASAAAAAAAAYQAHALMQLQQQPYGVPVSCEYSNSTTSNAVTQSATTAGLVASSAGSQAQLTHTTTTTSTNTTAITDPTSTPNSSSVPSSTPNASLLVSSSFTSFPSSAITSPTATLSSVVTATSLAPTNNLAPASSASTSSSVTSLSIGSSGSNTNISNTNNNNNNNSNNNNNNSNSNNNNNNNMNSSSNANMKAPSSAAGLLQTPSLPALSLAVTNGNAAAYEAATLAALTSFSAAKREEAERAAVGAAVAAAAAAASAAAADQPSGESEAHGSAGNPSASSGVKRPRSPPSSGQHQAPALVSSLLSSYPHSSQYAAIQQAQSALAYTGVSLNKQHQQQAAQQHHYPQHSIAASSASGSAGSAPLPITTLAAMQQYLGPYYGLVNQAGQSLASAGAAQGSALGVNPYGNPFAAAAAAAAAAASSGANPLLGGNAAAALGLPLAAPQHGLAAGGQNTQTSAMAVAQAQQMAMLQQNQNLLAAAAAAAVGGMPGYHPLAGHATTNPLGMYAALGAANVAGSGNPLSSLAHFNQSQLQMHQQYMSLANPAAMAAMAGRSAPAAGVVPAGGHANQAAAAAAAAAAAMANGLQPYKKMRTL